MKRFLPAAASAAACFAGFSLFAADAPAMKEGLWSIHTTSIDNPGNRKTEGTRSICRNHAYDVRIRQQTEQKQKQICKSYKESVSGNTLTTESECSVQNSVIKTKSVATFSGDSSIHAETHGTYTPALFGTAETTIIVDQKYTGACPAGMQPGDLMSADGKVTHTSQR